MFPPDDCRDARSPAERGEGAFDHGDVEDVLVAGLDWLRSAPIFGVPPRW
jgi:hypothetical protein